LIFLAIEPIPRKTLSISHSAFSMNDDDTNQLFSLLPSFNSIQRIIIHNQKLINLKQIYSDKAIDYVKQCYERHSVPNLNLLIKRGLLKIYKEKSIRMTINNVSFYLFCISKDCFFLFFIFKEKRNFWTIR
jgi:hypothetical protein